LLQPSKFNISGTILISLLFSGFELIICTNSLSKISILTYKFSNFSKFVFSKFNFCLSANKESKKFLKKLGANNVKFFGNLKFSQSENQSVEVNLLKKEEEKNFYNLIDHIKKNIDESKHDFIFENFNYLFKLSETINNFFDNVIVNDDNLKIRQNRKILINKLHQILNDNYRFSLLEI